MLIKLSNMNLNPLAFDLRKYLFFHIITLAGFVAPEIRIQNILDHFFSQSSTMNGINLLQVCLLAVKIKLLLVHFNNSGSTG